MVMMIPKLVNVIVNLSHQKKYKKKKKWEQPIQPWINFEAQINFFFFGKKRVNFSKSLSK